MSATAVREKYQVTLPKDVREAAGLEVNDLVDWRFEDGEIRGRVLAPTASVEPFPPGSLLRYFDRARDEEEGVLASGCAQGPE